jgi:hypothetical protein
MAQSALTTKQEQQILDTLKECVVVVRAGGSTGTGFFIAAGHVLTCRHVIEPALRAPGRVPISLTYGPGHPVYAEQTLAASVKEDPPPDWPDAAILTVPGAGNPRCVAIDSGPVTRGTPLLTAGFPAKAQVAYQVQRFTAGDAGTAGGDHQLLRIQEDIVTAGMSGSPVVNLATGLVCGLLGITKGSTAALGGFATLFADFIGQFPYLVMLNDQPPEAAQDWVHILSGRQLNDAGRRYDTGARWGAPSAMPRLDLEVQQGETTMWSKWQISVRSNMVGQTPDSVGCKISDLGDGVMRAVARWSRRQTIRLQDEVEVLGDVLRKAMLPDKARPTLSEALTTPNLLFRVCLDQAPGLGQLPWEYACGEDHQPFSAVQNMTFSRFVDVVDRPPEPKEMIRVLAVIECPESISSAPPWYQDENGRPVRADVTAFEGAIRGNAVPKSERIQVKWSVNDTPTELGRKLADQWDIVHYIGFAYQTEGSREAMIALGGVGERWRPLSIGELSRLIGLARCPVFIAEFHKFAPGQDMTFPADLSDLTSLLKSDSSGHPQALIVTQYPMNAVDLGRFNETFYESISNGHTVEEAVQFGRCEVKKQDHKGRDIAAFGSFVVTTTRAGEVRPLRAAQQGPSQAGKGEGVPAAEGQLPDPDKVFRSGASARDFDDATLRELALALLDKAGQGYSALGSSAPDQAKRVTG